MRALQWVCGRRRGLAVLMIVAAGVCGRSALGADPGPSSEPARRGRLSLVYVANEGVLVSSGKSKVLIDALFDKPHEDYRAPSPEVLRKIMEGEPPYDGVGLLLVTHDHPDHFDPRLTARYLAKFPESVLLGPADVVAATRTVAADWASIEPRVISLDIEVGGREKKDLKGLSLTAFRTLHSGDKDAPMNLMYLLEVDGWRVFHEGDSTAKPNEYREFGLGDDPVDLALVHFWFPLDPDCAGFLQEVLAPSHIALMHLPIRLEGDAPGKIDQVRKYYKDIVLMLPGMPVKILD